MRITGLALVVVLAVGAAAATAAELRGDSIYLCDALRQPSAHLRPSELWQLNPLVHEGKLNTAYARLADIASGAVSGAPGAARFLSLLRNWDRRSFDVTPDRDTEKIFMGEPNDTITIDSAPSLPQATVDLSTVALVAEWMRVKGELPLQAARAESVKKAARDAEDLLKNGLAMWPWELWLNGLRLSKKDSDPLFRTQWVFMRPTAGIEIDTYNQASADLQASVALEPVGFVRYRGDGYSHWWGASLVITASTNRGAGYGGLFRWDNYVVGVTRHKGQGAEPNSNFLLIGVDLYDLLNKKRAEAKDWDGFAALLK
jgi:hypothetical protein